MNHACHLGFLLFAALLISCGGKGESKESPRTSNYDTPTGNHLIQKQVALGDPSKRTTFWEGVSGAKAGSAWVTGKFEGGAFVGVVDLALGALSSSRLQPQFSEGVRGVAEVPSRGLLALVGGVDTNGDEDLEQARMSLVDATTGTLVTDHPLPVGTFQATWFNAVRAEAEGSGSRLNVVGGSIGADGIYLPLMVTFHLDSSDLVTSTEVKSFLTLPGAYFSGICPDGAGGYVVSGNVGSDPKNARASHHGTVIRLDNRLNVLWKTDLNPANGSANQINRNALKVAGTRIYVAGKADSGKTPAPAGGGAWSVGTASCLDLSGGVVWSRTYSASGHDDDFSNCALVGNNLVCVGGAAGFLAVDNNREFGLGWVAFLDPATGNPKAQYTLGSVDMASGISTLVDTGDGRLKLLGHTGWQTKDGGYQGWFVDYRIQP